MQKERLDKILAHEGFGSRKDIKRLLRASEVLVNNTRVFDSATQINTDTDTITIDGDEINLHKNIYLMMNKPLDCVSSNKDGEHQTVFELLDETFHTSYLESHLHLIGRLDIDTEGLLIFTTDGELTHKVISPKNHIDKTYFCILEKPESDNHKKEIEECFSKGLEIPPEGNEQGFTSEPACVQWCNSEQITQNLINTCVYEKYINSVSSVTAALLTIHEGKYHQVKRMFSAVNNNVIFLKRISMGKLVLDKTLSPGDYKYLDESDIEKLF